MKSLILAVLLTGCAYGQGYYLFPERHGYHFNPCQHYDQVKPQDRDFYVDECSLYDGWRQYANELRRR